MLLEHLVTDHVFIGAVCSDQDKHVCNNELSLLFFHVMTANRTYCLPIKHNEAVCLPGALERVKIALTNTTFYAMVKDKKSMIQLFGGDYNFIDLDILNFLESGEEPEELLRTNAHNFIQNNFRNLSDLNKCIPIYKHAKVFLDCLEKISRIKVKDVTERGFLFVNSTMTNLFSRVEQNGLCVTEDFMEFFGEEQAKHIHNGLVYSQYNLLTSTGRPSNRFAGVNYAALKKEDGSRNCFVSRYKKDGRLIMMDYSAFHPRLIAHLANFQMSMEENPYAYLAKYYFNKVEVNEEDIAVSKGFTFPQIYGGIDKRFAHIPYFVKVQEYIDHRWKFFVENGYVETPRFGRKIRGCHIQDPTPNKLFNYILQAYETEVAVETLGELTSYLNGKKTQPILYTYDSILFDAHVSDKSEVIKKIKTIMERDRFPVKVYMGQNYGEMKHINI
jgi:hypothetical protein